MEDPLLDLADTIATHLARAAAPDGFVKDAITPLVEAARNARRHPFTPVSHSHARLVEHAIERGCGTAVDAIAVRLRAVHASLPWEYHYQPRSAQEELGDRIAFAELIGPAGPLMAPRCRMGFTVMAERTHYPMHAHPAVELYWVICGLARWQTPVCDHRVPPGQFVLHRANEPHAMQTFHEPLLALWGWAGDIDAPAEYL